MYITIRESTYNVNGRKLDVAADRLGRGVQTELSVLWTPTPTPTPSNFTELYDKAMTKT